MLRIQDLRIVRDPTVKRISIIGHTWESLSNATFMLTKTDIYKIM